ncbi:MAG: nucleotide sugar dehydrogenase [Candidatus Helarchaeota archaeon]
MKILDLSRDEIIRAAKKGEVTLAVFGAGKLGLPVALAFANAGLNVIAVDLNQSIVDKINHGENPHVFEPRMDSILQKCVKKRRIKATTDPVLASKSSDVKMILIPTVTDENHQLDLGPLKSALESIGKGLSKGDIVILESTVPPGTTESFVRNERVSSGQILKNLIEDYPKIVSGIDKRTTEAVAAFYAVVVKNKIIKVSNLRTAEAIKVFKGIYRDVNIALANEFAKIADDLNIDVIEVIHAANTEPYSHIHLPGAGVGGHCIPVYPYFIMNLAELKGKTMPKLTRIARDINESMPLYTISLAKEALKAINKNYETSKISILGLTYRGGIKETRNVPAFDIIDHLKANQIDFKVFDPVLTPSESKIIFDIDAEETLEAACKGRDVLIFLTDHDEFKKIDLKWLANLMNSPGIIIDGRQIFEPVKVQEAGLRYKGIGRIQNQ